MDAQIEGTIMNEQKEKDIESTLKTLIQKISILNEMLRNEVSHEIKKCKIQYHSAINKLGELNDSIK